jgi:hypothetical protein
VLGAHANTDKASRKASQGGNQFTTFTAAGGFGRAVTITAPASAYAANETGAGPTAKPTPAPSNSVAEGDGSSRSPLLTLTRLAVRRRRQSGADGFSDAGIARPSTRSGGRRLKSAKARNRGGWGTGVPRALWGIDLGRAGLELTIDCLQHFHGNARWSDPLLASPHRKWRDVFNVDASNLQKALEALRDTGVVETAPLGYIRTRDQKLTDPLAAVKMLADRSIGWSRIGRIHGDLNLTNALCLLDDARKCFAAYIIDFSHTKTRMPIAIDYAKVEVR